MPEAEPETLRWEAYEHEHIERKTEWYIALGVIAVSGAITSILFGNVLFAAVILLAAVTLGLIASRPPELHEFEISKKGIRIGHEFHAYKEIISFWVDDELDEPLLLVDTTKIMAPNLVIPIGDKHPDEIRTYLRERADEVPMKEPIAHKILEFFGF
jgi:hypothetical protein